MADQAISVEGQEIAIKQAQDIQSRRAARAAEVMKGLENLEDQHDDDGNLKPKEEKKDEPAKETEPEEPKAEDLEPEEEVEAKEDEKDPNASKRLEALHRADKRHKESIAKREDEHKQSIAQRERAFEEKYRPILERAERADRFFQEYEQNPVRALLNLDPDIRTNKEKQVVFGKAFAALHGGKEPGDSPMLESAVEQLRRENYQTRQELQRYQLEAQISTHVAKAVAVTDDTMPAVKNLLANDPEEARALLREVGARISQDTGEPWPDPKLIAEEAEKQEQTKLKKRGIDPAKFYAKKPTKNETEDAGEKRTAKTLGTDLGTPTKPQSEPVMTREEKKRLLLRQLEAGADER